MIMQLIQIKFFYYKFSKSYKKVPKKIFNKISTIIR